MASSIADKKGWTTGQSINVTVDYSAPNLLAVKFKYEGKLYRGVLLAENQRIGVNESRAAGAESWHHFTDSSSGLSLKTIACSNERFTYKANGEVSRFSILHPSNKRLFPPRGPSRSVFRSQFDILCQNCKRSVHSSNPSPPIVHDEASTESSKRCHNSNDSHGDGKSVSSSKRRRLDETTKGGHVKPRKFSHLEGASVQRKTIESNQASPASSLHSKKMRGTFTTVVALSKESSKSQIHVDDNAGSGIMSTRGISHEKSKRRDRRATVEKNAGIMESQYPQPPAVPKKLENENPLLEPQHRPPIKIKINRSLLLSNGDTGSNKRGGKPEIVSGYKVEVLHNESSPLIAEPATPQDPIPSSPVADSASSSYSPLAHDALPVTEGSLVERYQLPSDPSITFRVGDVVWGKLSGWPWWPARITRLCLYPPSSSCGAQVTWFGTNEINEFSCEKILPFLANYEKKLDKRKLKQKQKMYKKAVEEALTLAQTRTTQLPVGVRDTEKGEVTLNNADIVTPTSPSEPEPYGNGRDFDGNGPLMIDHVPPPSKGLEDEMVNNHVLLSSSTTSTYS